MATHDYVISNGTGAAVRADLNLALAAIVSNNSSSSGDNGLSETRWAAFKLFLEKRFGRGYLKSTGLWGL